MASDQPLAGKTVGITAERRSEDQAVLFRRLGAEVVLGPTMHTTSVPDPDRARAVTEELIARPPEYVVANTGLGIRTWMQLAEGWGMTSALTECLRGSKILARGPKAAGAVTSAGLKVWWRSPSEQLAEVAEHLVQLGVSGTRVAFQLHGADDDVLVPALVSAGAEVVQVLVYEWSRPEGRDASAAVSLIELCCAGEIDAVTFTAGPQVHNMVSLADEHGLAGDLIAAFNRTSPLVACIGPVCASAAREEGIEQLVVPENWRLGSLVKLVAASLRAD